MEGLAEVEEFFQEAAAGGFLFRRIFIVFVKRLEEGPGAAVEIRFGAEQGLQLATVQEDAPTVAAAVDHDPAALDLLHGYMALRTL